MGYEVNTYVRWDYPDFLLWYESNEMIRPLFKSQASIPKFFNGIRLLYLCITSECIVSLGSVIGGKYGFIISKVFGRKQICIISSCALEARMSTWIAETYGRLCSNCGLRKNNKAYCGNQESDARLKARELYSIGEITSGAIPFTEVPNETAIPFISCATDYFNPAIDIPVEWKIDKKDDFIYIIHSYAADSNRLDNDELNPIKGTSAILAAVDKLRDEGYKIEIINPTKVHQKNMRFLQVQADFCVDELLYGWWGSTPLECAALGVPTILHLDPIFVRHWKQNFPHLADLIPFYNATPVTIYEAIKKLCDSPELRRELSAKSLRFAEEFLDPHKNAKGIIDVIDNASRYNVTRI